MAIFGQTTDLRVKSHNGFLENKGQVVDQDWKPNNAVLYLLPSRGNNVQLRSGGFSYDLHQDAIETEASKAESRLDRPFKSSMPEALRRRNHRIDIDFIGANLSCEEVAIGRSVDRWNYYTVGTPEQGVLDVHSYERVIYRSIYPGIDIEFGMNEAGGFKYDIIVHPGANLDQVRFKISGTDDVSVKEGELLIGTSFGQITERIPQSYHELRGKKTVVPVVFKQRGDHIYGLSAPAIPLGATLVVDPMPVIIWSTYYGGDGYDEMRSIVENDQYNLVAVGTTGSTNNIATAGAFQSEWVYSSDYMITTLTPEGQRIWGTYYGSEGSEFEPSADVDSNDNIFITGHTSSESAMTTSGAHDESFNGGSDVVLAKFNANGERIWSTYIGGAELDWAGDLEVDDLDGVYIAGSTDSYTGFATPGAVDANGQGTYMSMYIVRFSNDGDLLWGSYYDSNGSGQVNALALTTDHQGNVYVTGFTTANYLSYPEVVFNAGHSMFITKWSVVGQRIWFHYVKGLGTNNGWALTVGSDGRITMAGSISYMTNSEGFVTPGAYQEELIENGSGAFLARFDTLGHKQYATLWDAPGCAPRIMQMRQREDGSYLVSGFAIGGDALATPDAPETVAHGATDVFVARIDTAGVPIWRTLLGGVENEFNYGLLEDHQGNIVVSGGTESSSYVATPDCFDDVFELMEGFIIKYSETPMGISGETASNSGFIISPNPCVGPATLNCPANAVLMVHDQLGREVMVSKPLDRGMSTELQLDLSSGLYVVTMVLPSSRASQKLLVLEH